MKRLLPPSLFWLILVVGIVGGAAVVYAWSLGVSQSLVGADLVIYYKDGSTETVNAPVSLALIGPTQSVYNIYAGVRTSDQPVIKYDVKPWVIVKYSGVPVSWSMSGSVTGTLWQSGIMAGINLGQKFNMPIVAPSTTPPLSGQKVYVASHEVKAGDLELWTGNKAGKYTYRIDFVPTVTLSDAAGNKDSRVGQVPGTVANIDFEITGLYITSLEVGVETSPFQWAGTFGG